MLIHLETDASYENSTSPSFVPWTILIARAPTPSSLVSFQYGPRIPGTTGPSVSDYIPIGSFIRYVNLRLPSSHLLMDRLLESCA